MIDYFALALTHGLILLALIRIAGKPELDLEPELDVDKRRRRKHREAQLQAEAEATVLMPNDPSSGAKDA